MMNVEGVKNIEVEVLVKVLNTTISFEKSLNEYLISEYPLSEEDKKNQSKFLDLNAIEEIKSKYLDNKRERNPNRKDPNTNPHYRLFRVNGIISESFEPYMNSYVTNEEKKIKEIIINLVQNDRIEGKLYVSSLYLFNNINILYPNTGETTGYLKKDNEANLLLKDYDSSLMNVKKTTKIVVYFYL